MDNEILEICKKIDKNFDITGEDVELTEEVKSKLTDEEIEKVEGYIRKQKLLSSIDEKIKELENERKEVS